MKRTGETPPGANPGISRLEVWAKPGSAHDEVKWDEWRRCWVVQVTERAVGGQANAAILRTLAGRLGVPLSGVRFVISGKSRKKAVEVRGLSEEEIQARLGKATSPD